VTELDLALALAELALFLRTPAGLATLAAAGGLLGMSGLLRLQKQGVAERRLGLRPQAATSRPRPGGPGVGDQLVKATSRLVLMATPTATLDAYRRTMVLGGDAGSLAEVQRFLGVKGLLAIGLAGVYTLVAVAGGQAPGILLLVILAVLGFYLPHLRLRRRVARRQREIRRSLPDVLDLLTICVEAGLGFDGALGRVVGKRDDALGHELDRVLNDMRLGRSRREALKALGTRVDVPDVSVFVAAIVQSEQLGASISRVLVVQSEQMRIRRRQRAEELAQKAAIKLLFPMVFLVLPALFVVILGPALPSMLKGLA
jgi:tight adherence protein C